LEKIHVILNMLILRRSNLFVYI